MTIKYAYKVTYVRIFLTQKGKWVHERLREHSDKECLKKAINNIIIQEINQNQGKNRPLNNFLSLALNMVDICFHAWGSLFFEASVLCSVLWVHPLKDWWGKIEIKMANRDKQTQYCVCNGVCERYYQTADVITLNTNVISCLTQRKLTVSENTGPADFLRAANSYSVGCVSYRPVVARRRSLA